jgi:hypothetical protein
VKARSTAPLGVRGRITKGEYKGFGVVVDVDGMTPVDPLLVLISPDLDKPGCEGERRIHVLPEELDHTLAGWRINWEKPSGTPHL